MRKSKDTLTGGTKDVNPQWFGTPQVSVGTVGTAIQTAVPLPIQRLSSSSGRAQVMEVLKVEWHLGITSGGVGLFHGQYGMCAMLHTSKRPAATIPDQVWEMRRAQ